MNIVRLANEMKHPKMQGFLNEIGYHCFNPKEFNESNDFYGWLFRIYNDITNMNEIEWFFGYDCKIDKLGKGKFTINKDISKDEYHLFINNEYVASGSALWVIMRIEDLTNDYFESKPESFGEFLAIYNINKIVAIEALFQEKLNDLTESRILNFSPETIYELKEKYPSISIANFINEHEKAKECIPY